MALTQLKTSGIADDAVTTDKLANAINTERTANTAKTQTTINNNADNRVITGSGTANTLNGESNVVIDSSSNVGIGTTSPSRRLQIKSAGSNATQIGLIDNNSSNEVFQVGQQADGDGFVSLRQDDGTTTINLDASGTSYINGGNVGIGTTSPSGKLNLATGASAACELRLTSNNTGSGSGDRGRISVYSSRNDGTAFEAGKIEIDRESGTEDKARIQFFTNGGSGNTERMRIDSSGNLGVNTTAPVEKFGVAGNMRFVNPTDTTRRIIALPSGGYNLGTTGGSAIAFHRISDAGVGSDEIAFETHWQGNRHGESARISKFGGITFNGDTAAANALDDYEEGTWTPNIRNDGATSTWTTQQGRYVKIGQQVTVWFNADGGSTPRSGGGSGALIMTGLPFSQVMFGNPILGIIGANDNASGGLYSTAGLILNAFGQGGTQVRFGVGGQSANFGINYAAGCFTYTAS